MCDILLSIYIPTFRRKKELVQLLEKVKIELSFVEKNRVEVVVSDNDNDIDISRLISDYSYADKYYGNDFNLGAAANILLSRDRTSGRYIWVIGDDDLIVDGSIKRIIDTLDSDKCRDCAVLYLNRSIVKMDGVVIKDRRLDFIDNTVYDICDAYKVINEEFLTASSLILRRSYDSFYVDKYGLNYHCSPMCLAFDALVTGKVYCFKDPQVIYRDGDKSSWSLKWPKIHLLYRPYIMRQFEKRNCHPCVGLSYKIDKERAFMLVVLLMKLKKMPSYIELYSISQYISKISFYRFIVLSVFDFVLKKIHA